MDLLDLTLPALPENLALDEALLLDAEAGRPELLRLWEWPLPAIVVGAAGRLTEEIDEEACRRDDVPIGRRSSGGGAVLLGAGCLLFSLILRVNRHPALADLHASYRFILGNIQRALGEQASLAGISDLAIGDRKISGNAQQRKRTHLLHHGSLLYAFDAAPLGKYLKPPPRQPEYRQGRTHADFVTNVPLSAESIRGALIEIWQANDPLTNWPAELTATLTREKYATEAWVRRR
jgi:lipoate-protein ligase A